MHTAFTLILQVYAKASFMQRQTIHAAALVLFFGYIQPLLLLATRSQMVGIKITAALSDYDTPAYSKGMFLTSILPRNLFFFNTRFCSFLFLLLIMYRVRYISYRPSGLLPPSSFPSSFYSLFYPASALHLDADTIGHYSHITQDWLNRLYTRLHDISCLFGVLRKKPDMDNAKANQILDPHDN